MQFFFCRYPVRDWSVASSRPGVASGCLPRRSLARRSRAWRFGCRTFRAPLLIFPLLVGCGLGLVLVGLMRFGQVGHRGTIWSGTVLAVAVAVAGQHYFSFLDFKAALAAQKPQGLSLEAFQEFQESRCRMHRPILHGSCSGRRPRAARDCRVHSLHGAAAWASWALDGLLMLLATSTIIYLACRAPYCSVCRSWYRTTRAGPLAADSGAADG